MMACCCLCPRWRVVGRAAPSLSDPRRPRRARKAAVDPAAAAATWMPTVSWRDIQERRRGRRGWIWRIGRSQRVSTKQTDTQVVVLKYVTVFSLELFSGAGDPGCGSKIRILWLIMKNLTFESLENFIIICYGTVLVSCKTFLKDF